MVKKGAGTTNDENTSRSFFRNAEKSTAITGVDLNLIKRFHTILQVIASNKKINVDKFKNFAKETADLYVTLYDWYYCR